MNTYKKYLPYAFAIVLFAKITLIFFRPLLTGKELRQDDIARHKGMSKEIADHRAVHGEEPLWTNSMFGGMPAYQISTLYPGNLLRHFDNAFKLWLPHPSGYLFLYFLGFFILLLCLRLSPWLSLVGAIAYGLSSYFLIIIEAGHNSKANALGYLPALIGGVILLFNGRRWLGFSLTALFTAMELNANHVQISYYGYILIAFLIAGYLISAVKEKTMKHFAWALGLFIFASGVGLAPNAGNLLTTAEYGKYSTRGPSELTINSTLKKAKEAIDGENNGAKSLPEAERIKSQYERNTTTGLNTDYATQWSYGIGETFTFLIPDFKGGPSGRIQSASPAALKKVHPTYRELVGGSNAYFGDQPFTSGPVYIGAIVVFLATLGMFIVKHRIKWPLFFATALTVMLGWGSNFMPLTEFFMHNFPGYNKFRAVSMIMVIAELTLPLLGVLALKEILDAKGFDMKVKLRLIGKEATLRRLLYISTCITAGFCLLCYLVPDVMNTFRASGEEEELVTQYVRAGYPEKEVRANISEVMPQIETARKAIFRSDAFRSFVFIMLAFSVIWLFLSKKIKREPLLIVLIFFILIDLGAVAIRYLNMGSFIPKNMAMREITGKSTADEEILRDTTPDFRVLNLDRSYWNEASTSYYHKSVGGYHGAKLKKIEELRQFHLDREIDMFYRDGAASIGSDSLRKQLLSKLGVINMLNTRYFILPGGERSDEMALFNGEANGHAWFVKELVVAPDADDEILALGKIDTKNQAVVQKKFADELKLNNAYPGDGRIMLTSYLPNRLNYEYNSANEGFAVFSEIYYPEGWNAYLDGELQPHVPVNYVLRGMLLPPGYHKVEFRFEPRTYKTGNTIALAGSVFLIISVAAGIYLHRRNNVIVS